MSEFIQPGEDMAAKVMRQLGRAMQPMLTNFTVELPAAVSSVLAFPVAPTQSRPLYTGSRLTMYFVLKSSGLVPLPDSVDAALVAEGPDGAMRWPITIDLRSYNGPSGRDAASTMLSPTIHCTGRMIHSAAARCRIRDLEGSESGKNEAVALGQAYGVVSKWTSLLAVEKRDGVDATVGAMEPVPSAPPAFGYNALSTAVPFGFGASGGGGMLGAPASGGSMYGAPFASSYMGHAASVPQSFGASMSFGAPMPCAVPMANPFGATSPCYSPSSPASSSPSPQMFGSLGTSRSGRGATWGASNSESAQPRMRRAGELVGGPSILSHSLKRRADGCRAADADLFSDMASASGFDAFGFVGSVGSASAPVPPPPQGECIISR